MKDTPDQTSTDPATPYIHSIWLSHTLTLDQRFSTGGDPAPRPTITGTRGLSADILVVTIWGAGVADSE